MLTSEILTVKRQNNNSLYRIVTIILLVQKKCKVDKKNIGQYNTNQGQTVKTVADGIFVGNKFIGQHIAEVKIIPTHKPI